MRRTKARFHVCNQLSWSPGEPSIFKNERIQMSNTTKLKRIVLILLFAVLPAALLTGCRGDLGWARMDGPIGRQASPDVESIRAT
jgi:hypothetical protein